jgi:cell division protein FtsX
MLADPWEHRVCPTAHLNQTINVTRIVVNQKAFFLLPFLIPGAVPAALIARRPLLSDSCLSAYGKACQKSLPVSL